MMTAMSLYSPFARFFIRPRCAIFFLPTEKGNENNDKSYEISFAMAL